MGIRLDSPSVPVTSARAGHATEPTPTSQSTSAQHTHPRSLDLAATPCPKLLDEAHQPEKRPAKYPRSRLPSAHELPACRPANSFIKHEATSFPFPPPRAPPHSHQCTVGPRCRTCNHPHLPRTPQPKHCDEQASMTQSENTHHIPRAPCPSPPHSQSKLPTHHFRPQHPPQAPGTNPPAHEPTDGTPADASTQPPNLPPTTPTQPRANATTKQAMVLKAPTTRTAEQPPKQCAGSARSPN